MVKLSSTCEAGDDGKVGIVVMGKIVMEFSGEVEDLEGEIEVLLTVNDGNKTFWGEVFRPRFDWRGEFV